ncbi:MAG: hypothetical protein A2583_14670 [Bdellovibrionales bacterium RIFOXYD1_FULL_53_11]|nr:MAG: hypothetical protein A2583_14670 [Bdellovibrionales bacterium RIFOXYD1_FULL_53_11]
MSGFVKLLLEILDLAAAVLVFKPLNADRRMRFAESGQEEALSYPAPSIYDNEPGPRLPVGI